MISLGMISVQEKEEDRRFWEKVPITLKNFSSSKISVIVAEVSCPREYIQKNKRLQKKIIRYLKREGATTFCFGDPREFARKIKPGEMQEAIQFALGYIEGNPVGKAVWVLDSSGGNIGLEVLRQVGYKFQHIGLVTENIEKAEVLTEKVCDEFGVVLEVQPIDFSIPGRSSMVIDFDSQTIKVGRDILIDGRELSLDLQGFSADIPQLLLDCPELTEMLEHKAWLFGKKRLTR